jgi:hypothetical protein
VVLPWYQASRQLPILQSSNKRSREERAARTTGGG